VIAYKTHAIRHKSSLHLVIYSPPGRHFDAAGGLVFYRRFSFFRCRQKSQHELLPWHRRRVNFDRGTLP